MSPHSSRLPHSVERNSLTTRLDQLRANGVDIVDLTESNPTRVGIPYPPELLRPLGRSEALRYDPSPLGLASAREAVASDYRRRGADIDPHHLVLTASTSEAYSWLFKLLCNPGERVLVPRPSYPLFEHLARLEGVALGTYDLDYRGRWDVDVEAIAAAGDDVRALIVVSPNNPTGSCVTRGEVARLSAICAERDWALIVDEVFADYLLEADEAATDLAVSSPCLTVSLGGLSKSVGLPQVKLGWMLVGGPETLRARALSALEIIADSFLSVSTPVQLALPDLLEQGAGIRELIMHRLRTNMSDLRNLATEFAMCDVPLVDGGWSAVIRVPAVRTEEALVLDVLEREHILVYPGYFFDFRHEAYLVVSLLVPPDRFHSALPRVLEIASA
ncbi:MAG: pyridoxal phosphate-dependent aminotransferase [Vicinamibacterales bacterium]